MTDAECSGLASEEMVEQMIEDWNHTLDAIKRTHAAYEERYRELVSGGNHEAASAVYHSFIELQQDLRKSLNEVLKQLKNATKRNS